MMTTFLQNDSGAVIVDWVVLTAATVGLGLATLGVVTGGVEDLSDDVDNSLRNTAIITSFTPSFASSAFLASGDFTGLVPQGWGYDAHGYVRTVDGWTISDGAAFTFIEDGFIGFNMPDEGGYGLDLRSGSNNNASITQTVENIATGQTHTVSFKTSSATNNNAVEVFWGGASMGVFDTNNTREFETLTLDVTGGAGDGSNQLTFQEVGTSTYSIGTVIADITIE